MQAVAQQLPPPYQEFVKQEMKDYRFLFPIHDVEYEWMEKGERRGIEKGERLGMEKGERMGIRKGERLGRLNHAKATLSCIDADAAAALASCEDVGVIDKAIDATFRRLSAGRTE